MRLTSLAISIAVLVLTLPVAGKKHIASQILNARSVMVVYLSDRGPQVTTDPRSAWPSDAAAMQSAEHAITAWKRYELTPDPRQADLFIAVRTAHAVTRQAPLPGGGHIPGVPDGFPGTPGGGNRGPLGGSDPVTGDDEMQVYAGRHAPTSDSDMAGALLWSARQRNGLRGSDMSLMRKFRDEVEEAAKNQK